MFSSIFQIKNHKSKIINFVFVLCALCVLSGELFPQNIEGVNARLDAMGGSAAADDIGWTIGHPASIYKFPNTFQGSVNLITSDLKERTYGAIVGIVRFNDFLYAGVTFNNKLMMGWYEKGYRFYSLGFDFINRPYIIYDSLPNIPQVNLCLKLNDKLQIGIGGYFEYSKYEYKATKMRHYNTTTGNDTIFYEENHDNKTLRNVGFNIESRITLNSLTIYPQIMVGFPEIDGSESYNELDGAKQYFNNAIDVDTFSNLTIKYLSPQGFFLRGGSYFWADIGKTFWKTGVIYTNKRYTFNKKTDILTQSLNTDGTVANTVLDSVYDSIPFENKFHFFDFFLSFVPKFSDNLYFSPEYNGGIWWHDHTGEEPTMPPIYTFFYMYHNLRLGIEKVKDGFWFFDEIAFRCGIKAQWNKRWRHIEDYSYDSTSVGDESLPWESFFWWSDFKKKEARVSGGFGLKKGRGTFDVSCAWLYWQGKSVLTGPSAAIATLTVDFSRRKDF